MKMRVFLTFLLSILTCDSQTSLLNEIGHLRIPNAYIDDVNSIAIDPQNENIYASNTASATIDIISYKLATSPDTAELQVTRSIDIKLQSSPYFKLDYITSVTYSPRGYIIASLIPLNYARTTGWLVFIDTATLYIDNFIELKHCYSPKHLQPTSDGNKVLIACEGLADGEADDPEGSISVIDITDSDAALWKIYNIDFKDFDYYNNDALKPLPNGIYFSKPDAVFSLNVEPEYITIDAQDKYAYITLQENNGVAILDINKLEIEEIYSFGVHDFSFSGLDASDRDGGINIKKYPNLYGLRQPDGIAYYKQGVSGNEYILTANEGNPKYYDTLRVNQVILNAETFTDGDDVTLRDDYHLGRLQIVAGGEQFGEEDDGSFSKLYTFGSRDFTIWRVINHNDDEECPCGYPSGLKLTFSSYDDFEQITAAFGAVDSFNSDFDVPSFDTRSDDRGPEPESIVVGECSNGDTYVFIGLERVGGIMVYDMTDVDDNEIHFVQYLTSRDFSVEYGDDVRPPASSGDVEPETLIFQQDIDGGMAYLFVGYKSSASIGVYAFNCAANRNYDRDSKPQTPYPTNIASSVDECIEQSPCLNIAIRPNVDMNPAAHTVHGQTASRRILDSEDMYEVCIGFNNNNPYCMKDEELFTYGEIYDDEQMNNDMIFEQWFKDEMRCEIVPCGGYVQFAILDGDGCRTSKALNVSIDSVDDIECKANENDDFESCQWKIPAPECESTVFTTTTTTTTTGAVNNYVVGDNNENGGDGNGVQGDEQKENKSTFDTITNKGGHFYESAMFYILLSICLLTCFGIIGCVVRSQKKDNAQVEGTGDVEEEPLQFED